MNTPLSSILLVFAASFIGSFGAVFLKMGAGRLHRDLSSLLLNWRLAAGVSLYLLSFVFYYLGLRVGELSVLYPMVALGYIWTMVWSRLFFGEPFTRRKAGGIALILLGVVLLKAGS
ncbi:MAG: EamA family transporter [Acidobacteria bacterium]|nr:EamA family transporter [Acidobacteriota bacterium]